MNSLLNFKKHIGYKIKLERIKNQDKKIAFFDKHGKLYDVFPRDKSLSLYDDRGTAYKADYFVIDNTIYNLRDFDDVNNIPVPDFQTTGDVVFGLEYLLKMRTGITDEPRLVSALIEKTFILMTNAKMSYSMKDYLSLVREYMKLGRFDEAEVLHQKVTTFFEDRKRKGYELFLKFLSENELIISNHDSITCEICAIYQHRVYSVSGKDNRFPKLPDFVRQYGGFHEGCRHAFYPFTYPFPDKISKHIVSKDEKSYHIEYYDAVEYSNRPFVDDRTEEQKAEYLKRKQTKSISDDYETAKEYYKQRFIKLQEYELVQKVLGDKAPKSFSGYSRMKKSNTRNFQKIVSIMKENGYPRFADDNKKEGG